MGRSKKFTSECGFKCWVQRRFVSAVLNSTCQKIHASSQTAVTFFRGARAVSSLPLLVVFVVLVLVLLLLILLIPLLVMLMMSPPRAPSCTTPVCCRAFRLLVRFAPRRRLEFASQCRLQHGHHGFLVLSRHHAGG